VFIRHDENYIGGIWKACISIIDMRRVSRG
jgi:hypothetical protein